MRIVREVGELRRSFGRDEPQIGPLGRDLIRHRARYQPAVAPRVVNIAVSMSSIMR